MSAECAARIVRDAQRGDAAARARLADSCRGELLRFLESRLGPRLGRYVSVSDLCQESLLRALRGIERLRADATIGDFRRLLFRHAQWVTADHGRAARRFVGESSAGASERAASLDGGSRSGAVTRADEIAWVRAEVARLDPRYGEVLGLRLDGAEFREIAARLEIPEATVRKRYLRGAAKLMSVARARRT